MALNRWIGRRLDWSVDKALAFEGEKASHGRGATSNPYSFLQASRSCFMEKASTAVLLLGAHSLVSMAGVFNTRTS